MIRWIDADREQFKRIVLTQGSNVILADSTELSSRKDSRNGLGKSTLIEIIHFLLGSDLGKDSTLRQEPVRNWTFEMEIDLRGVPFRVSRNTESPNRIVISGNIPILAEGADLGLDAGELVVSREDWTRILGWTMFGLPRGNGPRTKPEKYVPTFRSLISYFIRRGRSAFLNPFEQHSKQLEWDKQVNIAFLLGLNWQHAQRWQILRDREKELKELSGAIKTGVAADVIGSLGSLESAKVLLEREIRREAASLAEFRVHPLYQEIEREANQLTFLIRDLNTSNVSDQGMLELYEQSLQDETAADDQHIVAIYNEAGIVLSGQVVRRLEEVQEFHREIARNRRAFLEGEIGRLRRDIADRDAELSSLVDKRSTLMQTLGAYGALEEYTRLQQLHGAKVAELDRLNHRIDLWQMMEREQSAIKIDRERLRLDARADLEDRQNEWGEAVELFNSYSEELYDAPGELIIDLKESGFRFEVDIVRSRSDGIEQMKVFCFDLMLARIWSGKIASPGLLIHDSNLYADVDVRQRARALQLAARESSRYGFQYICCLNSDNVPFDEFEPDFAFDNFVRRTLTDESEAGGLLGVRF